MEVYGSEKVRKGGKLVMDTFGWWFFFLCFGRKGGVVGGIGGCLGVVWGLFGERENGMGGGWWLEECETWRVTVG